MKLISDVKCQAAIKALFEEWQYKGLEITEVWLDEAAKIPDDIIDAVVYDAALRYGNQLDESR